MIEDAIRWFLAAYFSLAALMYTVRIVSMRGHMGRSPVQLGTAGSPQRRIQRTFQLFRLLIWGGALLHLAAPQLDPAFGTARFAGLAGVELLGATLMTVGLVLIIRGHVTLGRAWRSGIDASAHGPLVTSGPFAWSRNPMTIGILMGQVGLALAWPSLFTLVCLLAGAACVLLTVKLEEAHLTARFGADYAAYCTAVPRWLGARTAKPELASA
jgi:protein-S-isoprenylcysteine O-methyltransferase Ste14